MGAQSVSIKHQNVVAVAAVAAVSAAEAETLAVEVAASEAAEEAVEVTAQDMVAAAAIMATVKHNDPFLERIKLSSRRGRRL